MNARLVSQDGHPDIHLSGTVILVGRHTHCDVRIESSRVSRRHCCLVLEGDHLVVRDLDSTNGTFVNGDRVEVARMGAGDELTIGRPRYRLEFGPGPGQRPATRPPAPTAGDLSALSTWLAGFPAEGEAGTDDPDRRGETG